jgi:hypothetical protein
VSTHGSRFSNGYQFPRTSSARLERGQPIARHVVPGVGEVQIVPLTGGRRKAWDVCASWNEGRDGKASTYIAGDELEARTEYQRAIAELQRVRDR